MKVLLPFTLLLCMLQTASAQTDSLSAYYIKIAVERIEGRSPAHIVIGADTTITDERGSIAVHTDYYIEPISGDIEKIIEKTSYLAVTTEIVVYFRAGSPLLFSTKQSEGGQLKVDFDYYYQNGNPIYLVKRQFSRGKPDGDATLKWCYQLLKEFKDPDPADAKAMFAVNETKSNGSKRKRKKH